VDAAAEKMAKQLELAEKTLFALEAYLAQARQVIANTRAVLKDAESGGRPPGEESRSVK
jgi:hypothetical protein